MATSSTLLLADGVTTLATLAANDLDPLWGQVATAVQARDALHAVLPDLVGTYGSAAGTLAADWYDELRAQRKVSGRFSAIVAELPTLEGMDALAGWAVDPLFAPEQDWESTRARAAGGLQRRIADVARSTITTSSIVDPRAQGWARVGRGECSWCAQYLDGKVHHVEGYDFKAHDHCQCSAEPAW